MKLDYGITYVTYPEGVEEQLEDKSNEGIPDRERLNKLSKGEHISFLRNGYLIRTCLQNYKIPEDLCGDTEIQGRIVKPIIDKVTNDLEKIEDLLPELRKLHNDSKITGVLSYNKGEYDQRFKIHDSSYRKEVGLFEKTAKLKGLPKDLLKKDFENLPEIARWIAIDRFFGLEDICVFDGDFEEAIKKALIIYNLSEKLKDISVDIDKRRNRFENLERI